MNVDIDPKKFPAAAAYLARLPGGLEAMPDVQMQIDSFDYMRRSHPDLAKADGLPRAARQVLASEYPTDWIPEVLGNVLYLALRETAFKDDKSFLDWAYASAAHTFSRPWARVIMLVLSPTLVVMGAAKRWTSFHRGTTLTATPAERDGNRMLVRGTLSFPQGLYPDLCLQVLARAFEAAIAGAHARNPGSVIESRTDTQAVFKLTWDA